jgi:predicted ATPase/DNA-binding SARP family transcriptional activator
VKTLAEVRLLGPLELIDSDGAPIPLPAGKPRILVALLALEAGRVVSVERLVEGLWGEHPPSTASKVVMGYVSRLRKLLPVGALETREPGYVLHARGKLDVDRFEQLRSDAAAAAGSGEWQRAASLLAEALGLWRGRPLEDVADELPLTGELGRLEELRLVALEERIEADLGLGREARVVAELEGLVVAQPLRERFRRQLMVALYRLGRQADALGVYRETRSLFVEELGIEPGAELQELEHRILVQDEALTATQPVAQRLRLPAPLTGLVDRERERREIGELCSRPDTRLVTLVGPGGVGKTRIALAVAELHPHAAFVSLSPISEVGLVLTAIADAVGIKSEADLADWLRGNELLLVLDNFEHLLDAAPFVTELLAAAPALRALATSRTPLNVSGEVQYGISPLAATDAVDLFVERSAAVGANVGRTAVVEAICRRLDCLPLAIELAAAHTKTLSPELLLTRLEQRLSLLTRGRRDLPERQRTLRATIEWSHTLLEPDEQQVFARLSVFVTGCTLEAAEVICETSLGTLEALVDKSLVTWDGERFSMLETIHEYARERLEARGEGEAVTRRFVEWLTEAAETFSRQYVAGESPPVASLERELDNIRAALRAALDWRDDPLAPRLTASLLWFWTTCGRYSEGLRWTAEALGRTDPQPDSSRGQTLYAATVLAALDARFEEAIAFGDQALALFRLQGDIEHEAQALRWLANAHTHTGAAEQARALHAESIAMNERLGSRIHLARALRVAGDDHLVLGDPERALELLGRSLELARSSGHERDALMAIHSLGDAHLVRGDPDAAAACYIEALGADSPFLTPATAAHCLAGLAAVAALERLVEVAGRLWGAVESCERELGNRVIHTNALRRYEAALAPIRAGAFEDATAAGEGLSFDQATAIAVETFGGQGGRTGRADA